MLRPRLWAYILLLSLVFFFFFIITLQAIATQSGVFVISENRVGINPVDGKQQTVSYKYPVSGLNYSSGLRFGATDKKGTFKYREGKPILFKLGTMEFGFTEGSKETSHTEFFNSENIFTLLVSLDEDGYRQNGIQITKKSLPTIDYNIDFNIPPEEFKQKITKDLTYKGTFSYTTSLGKAVPVTGLEYISGVEYGKTPSNGTFVYQQNKNITFRINSTVISTLKGASSITPESFIPPINKNLRKYLLTLDSDGNADNGINISPIAELLMVDFSLPEEAFELAFANTLSKHNLYPKSIFSPSLGLNLEAAQADADSVGQPMPFVDIFRTARPFNEFSDEGISYDKNGWPIKIPAGQKAYTIILSSLPDGAIPNGRYTVLYDGIGTLAYDGLAKRVDFSANKDIIDINPRNTSIQRLVLRINDTDEDNPIRNIRIIMPGGICEGMPHLRVNDESDCAIGQYRSFATMLEDRNRIIFNPDYLRLIRNFKVLRMMNLMNASQHIPTSCNKFKGADYHDCVKQPYHWGQRSKMSDAVWGGSFRTDSADKHGVPVEVLVELANQSNREPWFNIPHNANDNYIEEFADYVYTHLNPNLKAYIEYSNETWNGKFWAAQYVRLKGRELKLDTDKNPFREGFRYYSKRSIEVFKIWEEYFENSNERLVRIIGSHANAPDLSRKILKQTDIQENVDALAIAPYFHACSNRKHRACKNPFTVPKLLSDLTSLDDLFKALDNKSDPYSLPSAIRLIKEQAIIAEEFDVDLIAYEGGQHLTVDWGNKEHTEKEKENLLDLFLKANNDRRMQIRYLILLREWKKAGGTLFTMYTMPQSPHRWGAWGIKSHLNEAREKAPKYDAIMQFQEEQVNCWWDDCESKSQREQ